MKTVLITGASSGIGYELAKIYAEKNYNLVIVARRFEKMEELRNIILKNINSNILIEIVRVDLAEENASYKLFNILEEKNIEIDLLINNAGVGIYGAFSEYSQKEMKKNDKMINLNIKVLVELTKIFVNKMLEKGEGGILNVASVAAFQPGPLMATYYASKGFVLSFSEALREELKNTGVYISVLCPGPTETEFEKSSNLTEAGLFSKMKVMPAEKVAKIAYKDFTRKKRIIIPGIINKIAVLGSKFLPRKLVIKVIKKIQEKKK
ncbi:SDR family oxidoreductase [Leptotrichia sp. OH3620_COT-345]|uniref:SDR family NAD(P)-dependent oxidoreductase n=1 Tax=Leptotrichia sp. OH3620_COT-345 TaxID=2491048 RepID=UPI000F655E10|nr:SDR family oxidoreductase [Leptotrichia sp. OH3620_COT-345]RRD38880.1 SDR family oxidoreductase [Leptotrichia sp. OH3620_COT-345]